MSLLSPFYSFHLIFLFFHPVVLFTFHSLFLSLLIPFCLHFFLSSFLRPFLWPLSLFHPKHSSLPTAFLQFCFFPIPIWFLVPSFHSLSFIFSLHPSVPFFLLPQAKKHPFSFQRHIWLHSTFVYLFRTVNKSLYVPILWIICLLKTSIAAHVTVETLNLCASCLVALAS